MFKFFKDAAVASRNAITPDSNRHNRFDAHLLTALAGMGQAWAGETLGRLEHPVPVACVQALGAAFVTCGERWHTKWTRIGVVPDASQSRPLTDWGITKRSWT